MENVESFTSIAADVVTDYEAGQYSKGNAAGCVVRSIQRYGKWVVLAASAVIEDNSDEFGNVPAGSIEEFLEEHYLYAGATVGSALKEYAEDDLKSGRKGELGRLYDALDKAGMTDYVDWKGYADSGMTPVKDLRFAVMPVPAGDDAVFIFTT